MEMSGILILLFFLQIPGVAKPGQMKLLTDEGMFMKLGNGYAIVDEARYALDLNATAVDVNGIAVSVQDLKTPFFGRFSFFEEKNRMVIVKIEVLQQYRINPYTGRLELTKTNIKAWEEKERF
ncbi:MAG: hypothetical protein DRQ06_01665 [Candidatus Hydrothermota bacterium]|nr:MAG: hypothetical protein DRQ06_01665 [Candidatus Hydrothermae bacterium]